MHRVTFTLIGNSPYSQSRSLQTPKMERETSNDHELRVWRERCHVNEDGNVVIPPMSIKNCLSEAAKFLSMKIPGGGKATYTKHFEAGLLCMEPALVLVNEKPVPLKAVKGELLFVPSDGKRGGSKRVNKMFPVIPIGWKADIEVMVLDEMITRDVLKLHLTRAGQFIGLGRFRPRNNGFYGRFVPENIKWSTARLDFMEENEVMQAAE